MLSFNLLLAGTLFGYQNLRLVLRTVNFTIPYSNKYDFNLTASTYADRATELEKTTTASATYTDTPAKTARPSTLPSGPRTLPIKAPRQPTLQMQAPPTHLASLSGYTDAETQETRFAAVWICDLSEEYRKASYNHFFFTNQTCDESLAAAADRYPGASVNKPLSLSVHAVDGVPYYHSVWRKYRAWHEDPKWTWALGESAEAIPAEWDSELNKVDWPLGIAGFYLEGDGVRFAGARPVIREPEEDEDEEFG
ncbi:hypothetical protein BJX70DRAFT_398066 [Aspergillus crustosus]